MGQVRRRRLPLNSTTGIIGLLLAASLLSACAKNSGSSPAGDGSANIGGSVPPGTGPPGKPRLVTPVPGLREVRPIRWAKAAAGSGRRSLTVAFWSGPCSDLDHVTLAEEADRVIVTLYAGINPSGDNQPCTQAAEYRAVNVTLSSPLGNRRVVDGAPATSQGPSAPGTHVSPSSP
jgi:hypothetical protein